MSEKEPENFAKIWDAFGAVIKEGIYEDFERRDQLLALSRFLTTKDGGLRTLKQYVADFRPNQTAIYYLVGDTVERLKSSPKLEAARARGVEVILLADPVDAFWTSMQLGFEGKPLKSLSQGEVDFGPIPLLDDKAKAEDASKTAGVDDAVIVPVPTSRAFPVNVSGPLISRLSSPSIPPLIVAVAMMTGDVAS